MNNANEYWESLSKRIKNPVETKNKRPDTSDLEVDFLLPFITPDTTILDVGSGSGLIINRLIDKAQHITAVEKFEGFSKFIVDDPKMYVINADLLGFKIRREFDLVLCMGVAQCFKKEEIIGIYKNLYQMTKPGGILIIRNHCGIAKDKTVNGFSEELGTNYFAQYRQVDSEKELLMNEIGFSEVTIHDIFPDTLNVWNDTRHYLFVCKKN